MHTGIGTNVVINQTKCLQKAASKILITSILKPVSDVFTTCHGKLDFTLASIINSKTITAPSNSF